MLLVDLFSAHCVRNSVEQGTGIQSFHARLLKAVFYGNSHEHRVYPITASQEWPAYLLIRRLEETLRIEFDRRYES